MGKYDLSTTQATGNLVFKEEHAKALKVYFDDFDAKYSVYEDFIHKLELYTDIINDRLSFKSIKISRISGVEVIDAQGKGIKLNQLSSGEKQEIVLFYELIFGTPQNVLLMIDEPEISLHILWQKKFMDDLLRIIEYKNINVIVATHSPQIINNHWERQIDLGDLYGQQLNKK
jgi:predicted ATP-binding protein involved in virulence